ncbi:MAG: sulfotransferase family protein [Gammaproteobacteria bacterium]|nr:sulfotransferase family protein [Gammaproteobacteria bacterium]MYH15483.1 sulfotransferase family protein [Gammaproteobacteria bacterium]MYK84459.1 sulfotransferase family protein [Gammaproteobacteria bacterium]
MNNKVAPRLGTAISKLRQSPGSRGSRDQRKIVLHYHLFKNAGTSIDQILKNNFGEQRWRNQEFPSGGGTLAILKGNSCSNAVEDWLRTNPDVQVLSSHTAVMPLPNIPATTVFPILFVRHPLTRLQSAYFFQRHRFHAGIDKMATRLAAQSDFAGYVSGLMARQNNSMARNFTAVRLAAAVPGPTNQLEQRALSALNTLPFVGSVERFNQSLSVMEHWLRPHFPGFRADPVWRNATQGQPRSMSDRLDQILDDLGPRLYEQALQVNEADLLVHKAAMARIEALYDALSATTSQGDQGARN